MRRPIRSSFGLTALAAALLLPALGCNAPGPRSQDVPELDYWSARGADFADMFELNFSAGAGLFVGAALEPIRASLGYYEASKIGFMGRAAGTWDEERSELFLVHALLCWEKVPCWGNGYLFTPEQIHRHSHQRNPNDYSRMNFYEEWGWTTRWEDWERPWMDVDVEVFLFCVGVDIGFSPHEMCDFLLGLFDVDAASHDDHEAEPIGVVEFDE